jgi:hypothetical protein
VAKSVPLMMGGMGGMGGGSQRANPEKTRIIQEQINSLRSQKEVLEKNKAPKEQIKMVADSIKKLEEELK